MSITLSALQKQRRDTAANWTTANPTLLAGEIGIESDTGKWKVGDGATAWTSLAYVPAFSISAYPLVNADISATAEIAVSKLADGAARQLLQTDAAGTGVEWASNIDVPGTLDVTGVATFDGNVTVQGDLTVNGTTTTIDTQNLIVEDKNIEIGKVATPTDVTADGGGITLKGSTDKTINWVDATDAWTFSEHVNIASAKEYRIAGTKVLDATSLGSGVISSSLTSVGTIGTGTWQGTAINKTYLDATLVSTGDTGTVTSTMIANGTIVNEDINASAAIAGTKISPDFGSQTVTTTGVISAALGSASAPSITFTGDLNTGIYSPAADTIAFAEGGVEAMRLDSSGRLGLGTSSPGALFHIEAAGNTVNQQIFTSDNVLNATASLTFGTTPGTRSKAAVQMVNTNTGNASGALALQTNGGSGLTTRLYINDAGSVGIGTTAPGYTLDVQIATSSPNTGARIYNSTVGTGNSASLSFSIANSFSSTNQHAAIQAISENSANTLTSLAFLTSGSSSTGNASERARIDSSGRLLVGTSTQYSGITSQLLNTAAAGASAYPGLAVTTFSSTAGDGAGSLIVLDRSNSNTLGTNTAVTNGDMLGNIAFRGADGGSLFRSAAFIQCFVDGTVSGGGAGDMPGRLVFSTTADGASSPTERMRISQNGASDKYSSSYGLATRVSAAAGTSTAIYFGSYSASSTTTGTISYQVWSNGNVQNTNNSYTGISDIKLKENIVDAGSQWDDLKALQVRKYNFKEGQTHTQIGLIAQEAELVSPGLVFETPDRDEDGNETGEVTKGINYSVLYMKAVKALQEAMERIEQLETSNADLLARVTALEGA